MDGDQGEIYSSLIYFKFRFHKEIPLTKDFALDGGFQGPLLNESNIQKPSYGLEPLSYVVREPNAAQVTVRCLHTGNMPHHRSREDPLRSEKELSLGFCGVWLVVLLRGKMCMARYRMKLI